MLTVAGLRKFKSTNTAREISDGQSGLRLLIHPTWHDASGQRRDGTMAWIMRFYRAGKPAKMTLGRVHLLESGEEEPTGDPVLGGPLTLRAARRLAAQISQQRAQGIDVIGQQAASKSRARAKAEDAAANSFRKLAVEFFRDHRVRRWGTRPRGWRGDAKVLGLLWPTGCDDPSKIEPEIIKGGLADIWGDKPLASIDGHDIHGMVDTARRFGVPGLGRRNVGISPNRGRKMHASLSNFFKWAVRHRKVTVNPVTGVWSPGAPPSRDRVLTDAEIKKFWSATDKVADPIRTLLRVLLLTGQRLGEVRGMRRDELSPDGVWVIPGARTKNHKVHSLQLPVAVWGMINALPRIEGSPYIFKGAGQSPCWIGSKVKAKLDEAMDEEIPHWTLHDLRRSCASGMQHLGVRPEVIERTLNHVSGTFSGVAGIYQRDALSDEVAAALLRWSQHVSGLISDDDKVVSMRKPKR